MSGLQSRGRTLSEERRTESSTSLISNPDRLSPSTGYGTIPSREPPSRSKSTPVHPKVLVFVKRTPKQLTVGQQSDKLVEKAKKNFFHGSFTSSHGAVFKVPSRVQQLGTGLPLQGGCLRRSLSPRFRDISAHSVTLKSAFSHEHTLLSNEASLANKVIVLRRRPASVDAPSRLVVENVLPYTKEFRRSQDLLALKAVRDHSTGRLHNQRTLSRATIARARRAVTFFEQQMERLSNENNSEAASKAYSESCGSLASKKSKHDRPQALVVTSVVPESEESYDLSEKSEEEEVVDWGHALADLLYVAAPATMSILFTFGMSVMPLGFVGSMLGESELTGASVGYFIMCILVMYPIIGLTFAMDTLCSHEYGRNPLSSEMGLILQRGVLINILLLIPLCLILFNLRPVLLSLYGPVTTRIAEEFLTYSPFYIFPMMALIAMNKFLNNQMLPQIPLIALTTGFFLIPLVQLILTPRGVSYTMIGMSITAWIQLAVVLTITFLKSETRATMGTWRIREALDWTDVKKYLTLAVPSAIFVAAEASSFDFTVLLCAHLNGAEGAAWSGIMNTLFLFASLAGGLSTSACATTGRCIGAGEAQSAKRYVTLSIALAFGCGLFNSVVLIKFYDFLMSLYGIRGPTLDLARRVQAILPFFLVADSVQFTFQGIFSGLGKNHFGAAILLFSLWCIGVPISFILGQQFGLGIWGICLGITLGLCIEAPCMVFAVSMIDYQLICDKFAEYEDDEEDQETDEEEEFDEEYIEEMLRRSGISSLSNEISEGYDYKRLKPPRQHGRRRGYVFVDENEQNTREAVV